MKRNTSQYLIPVKKENTDNNSYDINPVHQVVEGKIEIGYLSLAEKLSNEKIVILDGYVGVDWPEVVDSLILILKKKGLKVNVIDIKKCLISETELSVLVEPYLGDNDPIFGYKTILKIKDYFDDSKLANISFEHAADINIVYGTGASQSGIDGCLVYFDLPKNELQFRMRANAVTNFGFSKAKDHKQMYKHFYFVDWIVLNDEKKKLLPQIDIIVDEQRPNNPTWMTGDVLRNSLSNLSKSYFRVRPWFEPGIWGGAMDERKNPRFKSRCVKLCLVF